jgi:hypothetical protein
MSSKTEGRFALSVQRSTRATQPGVHIFLQRLVRHANGMLAVTPVCTSLDEIEGEIAQLKGELEVVLREARQAFALKAGSAPSLS